ncbi:MAG: chromosome segregation protein SMC [Myxococcales bacterium]|nr:chromosome segregation protein SMC [Myxococcales bacterium]
MHIKKLEISGFKSFADRTVIHFDHDVIGVVGPNGCGKSNVVDAIRWVLGEQSAKALRGKGMSDVIFSGSETRPGAGFAEVTITFDNGDPAAAQQLPLEYRGFSELAVTRRICKGDGASEYFINKAAVRLRDVTDVFLGTGVGRKAYSVVEQGKIGLIVSARPEDRRSLIEEAAGITKYKARKKQAETKMDLTRQNLTRVDDIVIELERQIGSLRRQAAKAERYVKYREEHDDLVLWDASHRLLELSALSDVSTRMHGAAHERTLRERALADARDAELEVVRQSGHTSEQAAERAQSTAFVSEQDAQQWETSLERATERYTELTHRLATARQEQDGLHQRAESVRAERELLAAELERIASDHCREEDVVRSEVGKLDGLRLNSGRSALALLDLRRVQGEVGATIARAEASLSGFEQRSLEMVTRGQRMSNELERLAAEEIELQGKREGLILRAAEFVREQQALAEKCRALAAELPVAQRGVQAEEQSLEKCTAELHRKKSRLAALEELARRLEGVGAGVRSLLATKDSALGGIIADRVEVPPELTHAFAALVGERLECVIVEDAERAVELLRKLASSHCGRASLIPRNLRNADETRPTRRSFDGARYLIDEVRFAPADEPLLRALLGNSLLVDSAEDAKRIAEFARGVRGGDMARSGGDIGNSGGDIGNSGGDIGNSGGDTARSGGGDLGSAEVLRGEIDIVTRDGIVFHADGRITGGSGDTMAHGLLQQKHEMRELADLVTSLTEAVGAGRASLAAGRDAILRLRESVDAARTHAHTAELSAVTATQDLRRLEQQITLVSRRRAELSAESSELESQLTRAHAQHDATRTSLEEIVVKRDALLVEIESAVLVDEAARAELASQETRVTERRIELASVRERAQSLRASTERVAHQHAELHQRIESLEAERNANAIDAGRVAAEMMRARAELHDARIEQRRARSEAERTRLGLEELRHELALREAELKLLRGSLDEATAELNTHELELTRLTFERRHLDESIRDKFRGLELAKVVGDYHARARLNGAEKSRSKELANLIERMGPVNVDAMREYEEASQRLEFYVTQRDDLRKALADLTAAIAQMNRESVRLFRHAFDGINRRFIELFPKMFRGGKAELRLTNPNDLLETGVDILAQPPGKRLSNIELMSGGEKAFTAVALLFAIFRYKPSPFCILDEVDAPLDDANVDRYIEAIRAMTDRSQFILITHSKQTMQAVDVLYGVTMQQPGVSKLVGVRVNETAARSDALRDQREAEMMNLEAERSLSIAVA